MTKEDVLWGYPLGYRFDRRPDDSVEVGEPRAELEKIIIAALETEPCVVAFSGGRDSSAILAVAVDLARRRGLPLPLPVTRRFLDAPRSEERGWQELVVEHLGLQDWVIEEIVDEMDVISPLAQAQLSRHGVLWSPLLHGDTFFTKHAIGGTVLDGEGGDNVLGPESHRIAPVSRAVRRITHRRRPRTGDLKAAMDAVAPTSCRARRARERVGGFPLPWLRPRALELLADRYVEHLNKDRLSFTDSVHNILAGRSVSMLLDNRRYLGNESGVCYVSPFLEPRFVTSLAHSVGRLGPSTRAASLELLCSDLLPTEIIRRRTKAEFSQATRREPTRSFARSWNGDGVDRSLVDAEVLREIWIGDEPNSLANGLLQSAWLAQQR